MTKFKIAAVAAVPILLILALALGNRIFDDGSDQSPAAPSPAGIIGGGTHPSLLYGRITTVTGVTYEGRLRFGSDEEAFWGDLFNGRKDTNRWINQVPAERHPTEREKVEILGVTLWDKEREIDVSRPFMVRFGDIERIEGSTSDVRVTLKSGTVTVLNRFDASDFDDGLRVWDGEHGMTNLGSRMIRSIEFLPSPAQGAPPHRLHGRVTAREGEFTGFIQWNRQDSLGTDVLKGLTPGGEEMSLRFDTIDSITRDSQDRVRVTLAAGREIMLTGDGELGGRNRGIYVDDLRYGRVLIPWDSLDRIDFSKSGEDSGAVGPRYEDFPPGSPLTGTVTTRDGRAHTGRLVFDLDESETVETLDAPSGGVDYLIPFGLIGRIELDQEAAPKVTVTLRSGEQLRLERAGDLGDGNAGMLVFVEGGENPEYLAWADVSSIELDRPEAMYPPIR